MKEALTKNKSFLKIKDDNYYTQLNREEVISDSENSWRSQWWCWWNEILSKNISTKDTGSTGMTTPHAIWGANHHFVDPRNKQDSKTSLQWPSPKDWWGNTKHTAENQGLKPWAAACCWEFLALVPLPHTSLCKGWITWAQQVHKLLKNCLMS